ncbi:ComEC/Rec2 family competence protein [Parasphingorhabdus halotolerans]|uniref:ComEC family competence protein n=1 Tax=Parasphingorhabdus halotolerans TaxID=2725558 RepID=A0A6H2DK27_9SPHN|nr:ComEC/Rec2 family competence protein [Parasphingorhabdus halotolerans]QJB68101.1 ComEC family competence protein [Parasphingorhabdus halotolerans]
MQNGLNSESIGTASGFQVTPNDQALSTRFGLRQLFPARNNRPNWQWLEKRLEQERDQLALWAPVAVACGIAIWYLTANPYSAVAFLALCIGMATIAAASGNGSRSAQAIFWFALLAALGCGLIWFRSLMVAAPALERPVVTSFYAEIEQSEIVAARDILRLTLATQEKQNLPPRVRVNLPLGSGEQLKEISHLQSGAVIKLRARLMPPAMASLPGAYDFSERAWFSGLGATGQVLGDIELVKSARQILPTEQVRSQLAAHVRSRMDGGAGAIGATLATGDRGAISEADAEAMRRSGLAHLLSISGLHVTAIVGAVYLAVLRILALSPFLALRFRLPIIAAGFAAVAALSYTLMTGAQVPTIRACVAAMLVLIALMMGRSAITLRMVAAGALFVLILWPESLVGPSFQLSFAAVTAIIALHELPAMKKLIARREESLLRRAGRAVLALFLTGLVVEIALMPIALYHFHKAGIYGALANIIAIPLTTFLIMPLEALALLLDSVGLGAPVWWMCEKMLGFLLALAHFVSTRPGAVTMLPTMSTGAFALVIFGGIWMCLWREKWRYLGTIPIAIGALFIVGTRAPDIYITGDGRHVGIRSDGGDLAMLRTRSGDFIRNMVLENAGVDGEAMALEDWPNADCNNDSCTVTLNKEGRDWILLATRSSYYIPAMALAAACRRADIVVSERRLPNSCEPRWLKVDRDMLRKVGGMTINLENSEIHTVLQRTGRHPWTRFETEQSMAERASKARKPYEGITREEPHE